MYKSSKKVFQKKKGEKEKMSAKENLRNGGMKKEMSKVKKVNNKKGTTAGITLVALVVTIVVLLILAGVTISLIMNNNGIINRAMDARDETKIATIRDNIGVEVLAKQAEKEGENITQTELEEILAKYAKAENGIEKNEDGTIKGINVEGVNGLIPIEEIYKGEVTVALSVPTPASREESDWNLISQIADAIKNDSSIPNFTDKQTIEVKVGENLYKVSMNDTYYVKYNNEIQPVRIIGFKHDDLADGTGKAGITFEFAVFMTGTDYRAMNSSSTTSGGWEACAMRSFLNGTDENNDGIKKLSSILQSKIKEVKKEYIKECDNANSKTTCNDKLWLLSCGEIWSDGYNGGETRGTAIATEGTQYSRYKNMIEGSSYRDDHPQLAKPVGTWTTTTRNWYLRSPDAKTTDSSKGKSFCAVYETGRLSAAHASVIMGVCPGFSI